MAVAAAVSPAWSCTPLDLDPAAVACARRNLAAAGAQVHQGDLYAALPGVLRGRVGILAARCAVRGDRHSPCRRCWRPATPYEPRLSLDGGPDGLDVARRAVAGPRTGWRPAAGC